MSDSTLTCKLCGYLHSDYLGNHLAEEHGISIQDYLRQFPGSSVASSALLDLFTQRNSARIERRHPPSPQNLTVNLMGIEFPVNPNVPSSSCLTLPWKFRFPEDRSSPLYEDFKMGLVALKRDRSMYVHGLPGSSKDSFFHAFSALTHRPGKKFAIKQGADIQSWFYTRSVDSSGTGWEEGELLKALRDGYAVRDEHGSIIECIPYIILISDFDRADRSQAEYLRLILDTIEGMVEGPSGELFPVVPGTIIAATGNTAGSGDPRGRMTSANIIDSSIMDRWDRVYEFHWMSWEDEGKICTDKFPELVTRSPEIIEVMGKITQALRQQIADEDLYAEFSHRAVCQILENAQDLVFESSTTGTFDASALISQSSRCWLDRLGDPEVRETAVSAMAPHLSGGMRTDGRRKTGAGKFKKGL